MVKLKLPFDIRTAQRLMAIANHPVISNTTHAPLLPPSWMTLYELSKLPAEILRKKIDNGAITPKMERKDVVALVPKPPPTKTATSGGVSANGHVKNPTSDVPNGSAPPAIHDIVAPDEELALLREFAGWFITERARAVNDPKDRAEFKSLFGRVKAILAGRST
jgi:hypothetical protein